MNFFEKIKNHLEIGELEICNELFYSKENEEFLNESSWDLASLFCDYLSKQTDDTKLINDFCRQASLFMCKNYGNPKELFLVYLENAHYYLHDAHISTRKDNFYFFIDLMEIILLRLSSKFIYYSIEIAIRELIKYINYSLSQDKHTNDLSDENIKIINKFIDFMQVIMNKKQYESSQESSHLQEELKRLFTNVLLDFFNKPFLNVRFENNFDIYTLISRIYSFISKLNTNLIKLIINLDIVLANRERNSKKSSKKIKLNNDDDDDDDDDNQDDQEEQEDNENIKNSNSINDKPSKLAVCSFICYAFSGLIDNQSYFNLPLVYDNFYIYTIVLPNLVYLLNQTTDNDVYLDKALASMEYLLSRIEVNSLNSNILELDIIVEIMNLLFRIGVYSNSENIRKKVQSLLRRHFEIVYHTEYHRFSFIRYFLNEVNLRNRNTDDNAMKIYVSSYLIYLFKEEVHLRFHRNDTGYFGTSTFRQLFIDIVKLRDYDTNTSDIVDDSTRVITCLNLIRFLLIRDKANETGIRSDNLINKQEYIKKLEKAIEMANLKYKSELNRVNQEENKPLKDDKSVLTILNSKEKLGDPTKEDKINSLKSALQTIDLIDCLRIRIVEIIDDLK